MWRGRGEFGFKSWLDAGYMCQETRSLASENQEKHDDDDDDDNVDNVDDD